MNPPYSTIGILGVTPEGASRAYRELVLSFYDALGAYKSPAIHMFTQPLYKHVDSFGDAESWIKLIQEGVDSLLKTGADLIWMPANSSHIVVDLIDFKGVDFINMVGLSIAHLKEGREKSLLLGTNISVSEKLYYKDKKLCGICLRLPTEQQDIINRIILEEMLLGRISEASRILVTDIVKKFCRENGVEKIFLACTELPSFFGENEFGLPTENSISVSIRQIIASYLNASETA